MKKIVENYVKHQLNKLIMKTFIACTRKTLLKIHFD